MHYYRSFLLLFLFMFLFTVQAHAGGVVIIAATDWEPYTGEKLKNGGFFTEITVLYFQKKYPGTQKFQPTLTVEFNF